MDKHSEIPNDDFEQMMRDSQMTDYVFKQAIQDDLLCRRTACKHTMRILTLRLRKLVKQRDKLLAQWNGWLELESEAMTGEKSLRVDYLSDDGIHGVDSKSDIDSTMAYFDSLFMEPLNRQIANVEYSIRSAKSAYVRLFGYLECTYCDDNGIVLWHYVSRQQLERILAW